MRIEFSKIRDAGNMSARTIGEPNELEVSFDAGDWGGEGGNIPQGWTFTVLGNNGRVQESDVLGAKPETLVKVEKIDGGHELFVRANKGNVGSGSIEFCYRLD